MGLDACVRCRCFEEGRLTPAPVPPDDLYVDEEDCLSSRTLDEARARLGYRRYRERFGKLNDAFREWLCHPCEHPYGDCCNERVGNWSGVSVFEF